MVFKFQGFEFKLTKSCKHDECLALRRYLFSDSLSCELFRNCINDVSTEIANDIDFNNPE